MCVCNDVSRMLTFIKTIRHLPHTKNDRSFEMPLRERQMIETLRAQ